MSYQTYITEALVCGTFDSKSSDRTFLLFTREAGMLYASAQSVREERSKHRYALQACSYVRATLVRGKSGWKITGTESIRNLYQETSSREARTLLRNIIMLLRRVIHGETSHEEIFDDVIEVCSKSETYPCTKLETMLTLRVLHGLGYVAPAPAFSALFHCPFPYEATSRLADADERVCKETITHAFTQSQL